MTSSRTAFLVLSLFALGFLAAPAQAGEGPVFGASDLALEEDGVADGWEIVYDELEGTPGEALETWATGVARTSGVDEDALYFETRILKGPEGAAATLLLAEVDGDAKTFAKDLATRGKAEGYVVREMGDPARVLVMAAPEPHRDALMKMQIAYAVRTLCRLGFERMNKGSHVGAMGYAKGARAIDSKAGEPYVIVGMVATRDDKLDEAIEAFRVGFARDTPRRAKGRVAMRGWAHYGKACLMKKEPTLYKEGREALEKAIALEDQADPKEDPLFIQRYNLACAHSLMKEVDEALAQLAKALEMAKVKMGVDGLKNFIERRVKTDEDFAPIKDHPGFAAVLKRAMGSGGSSGGL